MVDCALSRGVRLSRTAPSYLAANATSHTWPFSAIAELIDNAYDPDVKAGRLYIDTRKFGTVDSVVLVDDGAGMSADKLHRMLSFGFSDKTSINGHAPIGRYGNGFKSGSMRLGKDVIVFTKQASTKSVGFLSQTYLKISKAETVLVPILTWNTATDVLIDCEDTEGSLRDIKKYSLFGTTEALLEEFKEIKSKHGTKIVIYNLKKGEDNRTELDLQSVEDDIINPESQMMDMTEDYRPEVEHKPLYRKSLKEYCSILYLKPMMKIYIKNHKVKNKLISKSLSQTEKDVYKPQFLKQGIVRVTFGFAPKQAGHITDYGLMIYHKNRLIQAYERIGIQTKASDSLGEGVIGVVTSVDFLEANHIKQDFIRNDKYHATINALAKKLKDYCVAMKGGKSQTAEATVRPDWQWVQCDKCDKFRRLPTFIADCDLPKEWYCYMNNDPSRNRCDIEQEPEDEDEALSKATYNKVKIPKTSRRAVEAALETKRQNLQQKELELKKQENMLAKKAHKAVADLLQHSTMNSRKRPHNGDIGATSSKKQHTGDDNNVDFRIEVNMDFDEDEPEHLSPRNKQQTSTKAHPPEKQNRARGSSVVKPHKEPNEIILIDTDEEIPKQISPVLVSVKDHTKADIAEVCTINDVKVSQGASLLKTPNSSASTSTKALSGLNSSKLGLREIAQYSGDISKQEHAIKKEIDPAKTYIKKEIDPIKKEKDSVVAPQIYKVPKVETDSVQAQTNPVYIYDTDMAAKLNATESSLNAKLNATESSLNAKLTT
ncbi:unnamed protein product, partial [Owenia fusiformis]